jgi:hypothetical protein
MKNESLNEDNNRLRKENEAKKKEIEEEFGVGYWSKPEDSELPPEIEGQFLDHIMAFENAWKYAKQITLYEFLGNPPYGKPEDLSENEIRDELNRLNELMNQHQVSLDTICDVSDAELYRFITAELFQHEIDDMHIPGMMTNFIYEEFHPNHEHDIRKHSNEFMQTYLDKDSDYYTTFLSGDATNNEWHKHFRAAFSLFDLKQFEIIDLKYDLEAKQAIVDFECDFTAVVDGSLEQFEFNGKGTFQLVYQWDFWCVESVEFPSNHKI